MKKFAGFASMAVLAVTVVGCSDSMSPAAPSPMASGSGISSGSDEAKGGRAALPTIAGTAVASAPEFTTLVSALSKAGLVDTFSGSRQFTVFAPTNAAFDAAAEAILGAGKTGPDLIEFLDVATLTAVLQFHVTVGDRNAQAVLASGQVRMLDGNFAQVEVREDGAYIAGVKIRATDILASNGIIHVLDGVMLPPPAK
jgi:transforming growth factor-beta-induced protein